MVTVGDEVGYGSENKILAAAVRLIKKPFAGFRSEPGDRSDSLGTHTRFVKFVQPFRGEILWHLGNQQTLARPQTRADRRVAPVASGKVQAHLAARRDDAIYLKIPDRRQGWVHVEQVSVDSPRDDEILPSPNDSCRDEAGRRRGWLRDRHTRRAIRLTRCLDWQACDRPLSPARWCDHPRVYFPERCPACGAHSIPAVRPRKADHPVSARDSGDILPAASQWREPGRAL